MTFKTYFQEVQTLITRKIDLPFDVPFGVGWTDKYEPLYKWYHLYEITPEKAVESHFQHIDYKAEQQLKKKRKTTKL